MATKIVMVKTPDCGICKMMEPMLEKLAQIDAAVEYDVVYAEDHPDLIAEYDIMQVPTLLFYHEGLVKEKLVGFQSLPKVREVISGL